MTRRGALVRLALMLVVVGVIIGVGVTVGVPSESALRLRLAAMGVWAPLVFAAVYAIATLSPLPKSVFTLAAGFVFGVPLGLAVVVSGATAGAIAAFYLGRSLGRDAVQRLTGTRTARIDVYLANRGFVTILVARLIPVVPFTALNYVAGVTAVALPVFVLATVLGILPATAAYVVIGRYGGQPGSWPFIVALGGLLVLTVAGGITGWWRRRHLSQAANDGGPTDDNPSPPHTGL